MRLLIQIVTYELVARSPSICSSGGVSFHDVSSWFFVRAGKQISFTVYSQTQQNSSTSPPKCPFGQYLYLVNDNYLIIITSLRNYTATSHRSGLLAFSPSDRSSERLLYTQATVINYQLLWKNYGLLSEFYGILLATCICAMYMYH